MNTSSIRSVEDELRDRLSGAPSKSVAKRLAYQAGRPQMAYEPRVRIEVEKDVPGKRPLPDQFWREFIGGTGIADKQQLRRAVASGHELPGTMYALGKRGHGCRRFIVTFATTKNALEALRTAHGANWSQCSRPRRLIQQ